MGDMRELLDAILSDAVQKIDRAKSDVVSKVGQIEELAQAAKEKLTMAMDAGKAAGAEQLLGATVTLFGVSDAKIVDVLSEGQDNVYFQVGGGYRVDLIGTRDIRKKLPGRFKAMVFLFPA